MIVIGSFKTGGAERMSINTGEELLRRGYDVYYILQKPIFEIPNSIPTERIFVLRKTGKERGLRKVIGLFYGVLVKSREVKPDVIVAFSRFSSFLSCFTFHGKVIARFDMNPFTLRIKQRVWATYVLYFPFIRKVVVPSTGMYKALVTLRPSHKKKFAIIPNSINMHAVQERSSEFSPGLPFQYCCAMGRLSHQKNFQLLINAYSRSRLKQKLKLVIIGDGFLKEELLELVRSLQMEEHIVLTGQLKNPFPTLLKAQFFINSSNRESFCNVILEALSLSRPVVATDCDYGPADIVNDQHNGFLINNNDLEALTAVLDRIADDPLVLEVLRKNTVSSIRRFEIASVVDQWEQLIKGV